MKGGEVILNVSDHSFIKVCADGKENLGEETEYEQAAYMEKGAM